MSRVVVPGKGCVFVQCVCVYHRVLDVGSICRVTERDVEVALRIMSTIELVWIIFRACS